MIGWLSLVNGILVTVFGSVLSAAFCGAFSSGRNRRMFWIGVAALLLVQGGLAFFLSAETLRNIYPLTVHAPLVLLLYFLTKRLLWPFVSVLTAYLCCQIRRWVALVAVALLSGGEVLQAAVEIIVTLPLLLLLLKFVAPKVRQCETVRIREKWQFGVIPLLYYVFDYATVVYTDLLTGGDPEIVEFMPFVCCVFYLFFLLYHFAGEEKRNWLRQVQKSLDLQLSQSMREISALRESQELTRRYRHDLRHHLQYVSACIGNGQEEQAQTYISGICEEIEAQVVEQYCENEAANLILSSFVGRAQNEGIDMSVRAMLPALIPVSDSDLCVLLSNALENAIHACRELAAGGVTCTIDVQCFMREEVFFLQIKNPCRDDIRFENNLPVSDRPGHGIGVQSICAIVDRYGGVCDFSVMDGQFILQLSL